MVFITSVMPCRLQPRAPARMLPPDPHEQPGASHRAAAWPLALSNKAKKIGEMLGHCDDTSEKRFMCHAN